MKRVDSGNINRLEYKDGGGCMMLFGLPFLLGAAFGLYGAIYGGWKTKSGAPAGFWPPFIFCLMFGGVGVTFVFGRMGTIIDKTVGTITKWWGILWFPIYSKNISLADVRCVSISHETRKTKNGSYSVYPVRLRGNSGDVLHLSEPRDTMESRRLAEEVAQFLHVPLRDSSMGETVTRQPEELQESLRDKLIRTNQEVSISAPPSGAKCAVSAEGNRVIFDIPPQPLMTGCTLGASVGVIIFIVIFVSMFATAFGANAMWVIGAAVVIGLVLISLQVAVATKTRWQVTADPQGLRVTTMGVVRSSTDEMSADKLEELRVHYSGTQTSLLAISDQKTIRFGAGLSSAELEWMRALIMKALSA
ncbi:MAG TPA: hypothetical protein VEJ63_01290 [Planctomycetota bacterium]|nr:hypothetical protein [Planctomycetota bacterium]